MGLVTEHFMKLIQRQVDEHGLVLWCDPDHTYAALAANLTLPDTRVARFTGSYLALRREIDDALNDLGSDSPPRLVVYHPAPLADADHALDELVKGGIVMQPGGQSLPLNTKLETVARHALRPLLPAEKVDSLCEQIRKNQISSLDELDELAGKTEEIGAGALALIYGTGQPIEIALNFVAIASRDDAVLAKSAGPQLATILNTTFGASLPLNEEPGELRARFRKHLLLTEFCASLMGDLPAALAIAPNPPSPAREACIALVRAWRNRRDLQSAYAEAARRVEIDYGLGAAGLQWTALRQCETFPGVEARLQSGVEEAWLAQPNADLIQLADSRQNSFWAETEPLVRGRWTLIATAGRILLAAHRILETLEKTPPTTAAGYIECYRAGPEPWCQLDTDHRTLERLAINFDLDPDGAHASLEKLLARARQQYTQAVDALAQKFVRTLADESFAPAGTLHQTEVFSRCVAPLMASGKTAYVLVDALRYEMARDLAASLNPNWRSELSPAIATAPTITPIGMAALLPAAERGLSLVDAGRGRLAAEVGGHILKDRKERVAYLESKLQGFVELKLEDLVPLRKANREKLKSAEARFIFITSQEIDLLGEGDSSAQAREFIDSALGKLARAFRALADLGVRNIIVAADHGYLFVEELDSDRTLPAPGGQTVDLHRRVWVGRGGQALEGVLRVPAQALNLGGDYELATPYGLACFAAPSGRAYLHGGLSLQELIIPVLTIQPTLAPVTAQFEWSLQPGSAKLTTRFFSAIVGGQAVGMFDLARPRIRVEIQAHNKTVSAPVSATYGFSEATGEVEMRFRADAPEQLEPNTITIMVTGSVEAKTVKLVLVDAQTEKHPKEVELESAIVL